MFIGTSCTLYWYWEIVADLNVLADKAVTD